MDVNFTTAMSITITISIFYQELRRGSIWQEWERGQSDGWRHCLFLYRLWSRDRWYWHERRLEQTEQPMEYLYFAKQPMKHSLLTVNKTGLYWAKTSLKSGNEIPSDSSMLKTNICIQCIYNLLDAFKLVLTNITSFVIVCVT